MKVGDAVEPVRDVECADLGVFDFAVAGAGAEQRAGRPCRDRTFDFQADRPAMLCQAIKLDARLSVMDDCTVVDTLTPASFGQSGNASRA